MSYSCTQVHKTGTQTVTIKYKTIKCILIYIIYYKLETHAVAYTFIAGD